jgi:hypothetical protein
MALVIPGWRFGCRRIGSVKCSRFALRGPGCRGDCAGALCIALSVLRLGGAGADHRKSWCRRSVDTSLAVGTTAPCALYG